MYSISNVKTEDLAKIEVKNQSQIVELVGKKLNPIEGFEIIRKESNGFTNSNKKAAEADAKFLQLLKLNGITISGSSKAKATKKLNVQAQARARALSILELELSI